MNTFFQISPESTNLKASQRDKESNPGLVVWSHPCCHYTIPISCDRVYRRRSLTTNIEASRFGWLIQDAFPGRPSTATSLLCARRVGIEPTYI